jgi:hypothetical protein
VCDLAVVMSSNSIDACQGRIWTPVGCRAWRIYKTEPLVIQRSLRARPWLVNRHDRGDRHLQIATGFGVTLRGESARRSYAAGRR